MDIDLVSQIKICLYTLPLYSFSVRAMNGTPEEKQDAMQSVKMAEIQVKAAVKTLGRSVTTGLVDAILHENGDVVIVVHRKPTSSGKARVLPTHLNAS